jgi:hypothetical protein
MSGSADALRETREFCSDEARGRAMTAKISGNNGGNSIGCAGVHEQLARHPQGARTCLGHWVPLTLTLATGAAFRRKVHAGVGTARTAPNQRHHAPRSAAVHAEFALVSERSGGPLHSDDFRARTLPIRDRQRAKRLRHRDTHLAANISLNSLGCAGHERARSARGKLWRLTHQA